MTNNQLTEERAISSAEMVQWEYETARTKMERAARKEEERLNSYGIFDMILDQAEKIHNIYKNVFRSHNR